MGLNFGSNLFPSSRENLLVSYDFIDMLTNQGYINFYLGTATNETAVEKNVFLTEIFTSKSSSISSTVPGNVEQAYEKEGDQDYDYLINKNQTIEGKTLFKYKWDAIWSTGGGGSDPYLIGEVYMLIRLRKWDGVTETELGYATTATHGKTQNSNTVTTDTYNETMLFNCAKTNFKKGDILRITVESWIETTHNYQYTGTTSLTIKYYITPASSTDYFKAAIPFKIEDT